MLLAVCIHLLNCVSFSVILTTLSSLALCHQGLRVDFMHMHRCLLRNYRSSILIDWHEEKFGLISGVVAM